MREKLGAFPPFGLEKFQELELVTHIQSASRFQGKKGFKNFSASTIDLALQII
jgi:hypothetical protein